jgi:hypothetical protein
MPVGVVLRSATPGKAGGCKRRGSSAANRLRRDICRSSATHNRIQRKHLWLLSPKIEKATISQPRQNSTGSNVTLLEVLSDIATKCPLLSQ